MRDPVHHARSMFPWRLKELREDRGMSATTLGKKVGVSHSGIQKMESGEKLPLFRTMLKLAEEFGVSLDYLVGRSEVRGIAGNSR